MSKLKLEGIFVPHITPFKHNGEINEGALRELIQFWIQGGLSGLVPCGSNGEAPYLLREERKRGLLLETAVITPNRIKLGEYFLMRKLKSYGRTYVPYSLIQERLNIV